MYPANKMTRKKKRSSRKKTPVLNWKQWVEIFKYHGYEVLANSPHIIMKHPDNPLLASIPKHKEIKLGTMKAELRKAKLEKEDVIEALNNI